MKFDTIIIGGGLSGLVAGNYLVRHGQRCVIISSGQSALHFSSGSLDLLNFLPDGTAVSHPSTSVAQLVAQAPAHPYAKLGVVKFNELTAKAERLMEEWGIQLEGSALKNHYRVTPMGTLKPTWLTLKEYAVAESENSLPWKKVAIFNVAGFLDFYTQFVVDEFRKWGTECESHLIHLPALENLRKNPSEMRSVNIARLFDQTENLDLLALDLQREAGDVEVILLPAVLGITQTGTLKYLCQKTGKEIRVLPTLPPSVPGIRTQQRLRKCFQDQGGVYMLGDTVLRAEKEQDRVVRLYSYNHGDIPFVAENVILASGSYFSQGLVAAPDRVYEPIFDLDVDFVAHRNQWYDLNVFARQPYHGFGVKTTADFRGLYRGQMLKNVYVAGALLEGFNPIKEGCGGGVSVLTALYVAEQILSK